MESTMQRQRRPPLPPPPPPRLSGGRGLPEWTDGDPPGAGGETLLLCWEREKAPKIGERGQGGQMGMGQDALGMGRWKTQ